MSKAAVTRALAARKAEEETDRQAPGYDQYDLADTGPDPSPREVDLQKTKRRDLRRTMTDYHRQLLYEDIARRILDSHSPSRICSDLKISRNTLRGILRSQVFKHEFEKVRARIVEPIEAAMRDEKMGVAERVEYGTQRALTRAFALMENAASEHVRKDMINSILDRHPKTAKIRRAETHSTEQFGLTEETAELLARALDAPVARGDIVDVEAIEDGKEGKG